MPDSSRMPASEAMLGQPWTIVEKFVQLLNAHRFRFQNETDLKHGIERILAGHDFSYRREFSLSRGDRPDFWLAGCIAVEVKIKGSFADALRQVTRYARHDQVAIVMLVGTPLWLPDMPQSISGKPLVWVRTYSGLM